MSVAPLVGKQLASVQHATARLNIWEGSVRSGKTIGSILAWLRFIRTAPPGNLLMAGRTERTLERNVVHPMQDMLGRKRVRFVRGAGELWVCGRRIYIAGANDERAQEKIRGLTLVGAYVDEVSTVPESFWSMLLTRLSIDGARLFGTTNPDNPRHWLLKDYLNRATVTIDRDGQILGGDGAELLDLARFRFTLHDNPHLPAAYIASLEREFVGLWYRRFILGEWVAAEGAIYDMLDLDGDSSHVVDQLPDVHDWWLTVDYGTTNPFVALLIGEHTDGLVVAREWRWDSRAQRRQLTDGEYATKLQSWVDGGADGLAMPPDVSKVFVDPSAASFIRQLYRDGWSGVTPADNTVEDGIRETSSLLAARRLTIHRSCSGLLDEMAGYSWDPKAQDRGEDAPLKQDDHGPDALRYGVRMLRRVWRRWLDS
ncbi:MULTISPECIES: PBSX family phage terminase large subunit [unclassified Egicoccus]|uniref:PBSX family phage terminase large subunit n=1 Tax=unclassified Egicoccus TaxID=2635606 RepID=UPI00359D9FFC